MVVLKRNKLIVAPREPTPVGLAPPVDRMLSCCLLSPAPPLLAPEIAPQVAVLFDKLEELSIGDGRTGHAEGADCDMMRPLLVVKNKGKIWSSSQHEQSAWNFDLPKERPTRFVRMRVFGKRDLWARI